MARTEYLYLVAANIGAVIMPWMVFYQQSSVVEKKLTMRTCRRRVWDTASGAVVTQVIMAAVLIATAATLGTSLAIRLTRYRAADRASDHAVSWRNNW